MLLALTLFLLLLYALLLFYYFHQWNRQPVQPPAVQSSVFVSVLVAARNEAENLPHLIRDLQQQEYPPSLFEVLLIDDHSTDGTAALAQGLPPNMQMLQSAAAQENSSKKAALTTGIQQARGPLLAITDADCRLPPTWLQALAAAHQQHNAAFVAAPVAYQHDGSLLQVFQALDFLTLQGITAAVVGAGAHAMCNGANLAYTKEAFHRVNGFAGIDQVATGDDMLLMHKIWKAYPHGVVYLKNPAAVVHTAPAPTWRAFVQQRRRWASKTLVYDDKRLVAVLAFVLLVNLQFFVLLVAGFFNPWWWLLAFVFWVAKTVAEWPFVSSVARFFGQSNLMRHFFFLQPLHMFYTVAVGIGSQFGKYQWKGRKTR